MTTTPRSARVVIVFLTRSFPLVPLFLLSPYSPLPSPYSPFPSPYLSPLPGKTRQGLLALEVGQIHNIPEHMTMNGNIKPCECIVHMKLYIICSAECHKKSIFRETIHQASFTYTNPKGGPEIPDSGPVCTTKNYAAPKVCFGLAPFLFYFFYLLFLVLFCYSFCLYINRALLRRSSRLQPLLPLLPIQRVLNPQTPSMYLLFSPLIFFFVSRRLCSSCITHIPHHSYHSFFSLSSFLSFSELQLSRSFSLFSHLPSPTSHSM